MREILCQPSLHISLSLPSLHLCKGDLIEVSELEERVQSLGFEKVDFVYEPGQYSVRGGIFDIFSYSESKPYRFHEHAIHARIF